MIIPILMIETARKYLKAFRLGEVFVLTGFCLIGGVFSVDRIDINIAFRLFLILWMAFFLLGSLYAFNALCGRQYDIHNERLHGLDKISNKEYIVFFVIFLVLSIVSGYFLNEYTIYFILTLTVLGIIYSLPGIGLKNIPFGGTAFHFFFPDYHVQCCIYGFSANRI